MAAGGSNCCFLSLPPPLHVRMYCVCVRECERASARVCKTREKHLKCARPNQNLALLCEEFLHAAAAKLEAAFGLAHSLLLLPLTHAFGQKYSI